MVGGTRRWRPAFDPGEARVLVAMSLAMTVVEGVRPAASYRAIELGAGAFQVGLVAGAFASLAFIAALPIGRAIDRVGERVFFVAGGVLLLVAALVGVLIPWLVALVVMQALLGLGQVCLSISAQTMAGNTTSSLDLRFARLSVAVAIGHFLGPLIAGTVIDADRRVVPVIGSGPVAFLAVAAVLAVATLVVGLTIRRPSDAGRSGSTSSLPPIGALELLRLRGMPQALYVGIVALTTLDLFVAYLPVLGEERGIPPSVIGYLLATRALLTIASRLTMGVMLRRLGRRGLLRTATAIAAFSVLGLVLPGTPVWLLFVCMAIVGFAGGVAMPMTTAWVADRAPAGSRGAALGLRLTGNRASQVAVPVALGGVAASLGAGSVFAVVSVAFGLAWHLVRQAPIARP